MKIDQMKETLLNKGFDEEKLDTGFNFTKTIKNVQLICYIGPNINVSFITVTVGIKMMLKEHMTLQ